MLTGDCPQWTSIFPSCCLGSLLNRNWSKPWIAQYIAIHSGMSFTVKRLLRTAPKWHTSYLYLSPKIKLFHSKIFYFFSFSLFFSSVAVLFFLSEDISWLSWRALLQFGQWCVLLQVPEAFFSLILATGLIGGWLIRQRQGTDPHTHRPTLTLSLSGSECWWLLSALCSASSPRVPEVWMSRPEAEEKGPRTPAEGRKAGWVLTCGSKRLPSFSCSFS